MSREQKLEAALREIVTHPTSDAAEIRCLAARALDDPIYWHLYREVAMLDDLRKKTKT